ncbi:hypothetical protein QYE76_015800 [Lolium multiflorum]|uniref:CCHC-type domain-containing protein n=1 Tax=Lolium multiflorum TaxID=4521 RepID=A0AAD8U7N5_LOLMU|nr:hypothetical protein QYE76_015800 [Lolium multiflorum]
MILNDKKKRACYNCDEESHFTNECPYERVDKPKFIKGVKPRLKPNPTNDRYKRNKGRAFVGAEYLSDEEEEDEEKEAGVAGLAFSKPGSLFTYDYSKDYSTENDVGSSFIANKLVKDELKKLGKNHDLLQETYSKALDSMNDSIVDKNVASSSTTFTSNDDDPSSAMKHMVIGHIRPVEVHNDDQGDGVEVSSSPQVEPSSNQVEPSSDTRCILHSR